MTKLLELTEDEFQVLYEFLADTIDEMDTWDIEDGGFPLSEYVIVHIFNKLNRLQEKQNAISLTSQMKP
tara:strand:+ start:341 stop:547 length:207 start_codon:yes stop_codon:yes gene_type:complete